MTNLEPHRVELTLRPAGDNAAPYTFVVTLRDLSLTGVEIGFARLFAEMSIDDRGTTLADVVDLFTTRRGLRHADALAFGRFLYRRLLGPSEDMRRLWAEIDADRKRTGRSLHFVVVLPAHDGDSGGHEALWSVADLPFELLADDHGFLFQRSGNILVRTFHGLARRTPSIPQGGKATLAWANPQILSADGTLAVLPGDVFARHEAILAKAAPTLGLALVPPCDHATRGRLGAHLVAHAPVHLVSIVAHGADAGGAMLLHDEQDGQATDAHTPVLAQQLATMLRAGGVDVALLWTCYSARHHRSIGSLAEALLRPEGGDVPVVVASHAALDASATVDMARALFDALSGAARRDFERALSETWQRALDEDNLQWAAPVYYARPEPTRPARIETAMAAADQRTATEHSGMLTAPKEVRMPIVRSVAPEDFAIEHAPPLTEHFRGRHAEVNRGLTLLAERRLVSIHGMPGIGKTALSLAISSIALGRGAFDRAVWHPLDGVRTVDILAARLAQDTHAQDMDAATIARAMGRDRSWLVVLDNAEDLIDADRAGLQHFLDALLREHEGLRLLLTTRRRLGDLPMAREALLSVGRLEPPHDLILFQATAGERLMSAARDGDEVRELVELLDGHPQSIVLVASQVDLLPLSIIRHRLERDDVAAVVAAELIGNHDIGDRAAAKRAQRLLASLDLSYLPLASRHPAAAEMFAWLGALPAGLPAVLAPRVFSEDADEHLAVLLQYNLVEQRGPDRRLGMPAPLRWYATRHIADLAEDRQRALLNSTTLALADWVSAMKSQVGTSAARHAFDRALAEQPNLASLMEYITTASDPTLTIRWSHTVGRWSQVMQHAGRTTAAIPVVEQANAMQPPGSEGDAYTRKALGNLYARTDRLKEAEQSYLDALSIYRQIKDRSGEANIREALGDLYVRTDRLKEAEQSYLDALPIYRQIEDRLGVADTLLALGDLYVRTDRLKEAEQSYLDALPIYRQIEDRLGVASTLRAMGDFYVCTHKLKDAEQSYLDALPIFRQIEGRLGEAHTLLALGNLYVRSHRLKDAEQSYLQALPIFPQIEARGGEADTLLALGNLYIRSARWRRAEQSYLDALPIYRQIEKRLGEANTRKAMGDLYVLTARLENAEQSYLDALPIYLQIGDRLGEANTLRALGDLYVRTDRLTDAELRYLDALQIYRHIEARLGEANTLRALGDLYVRIDRLSDAEQRYLDALPIYRQIQEHLGEANTLLALGDLYVRTDRLKDAEQNYLNALPIYHQVEDRLGEANTQQSIGNLALAQGLVVPAFAHYRQALVLHEAIGDKVGMAADHGYLARAAQAAGALERAVVLGARALEILHTIDDRFGQRLALDDMNDALAGLKNTRGAIAAMVLAWELACSLGELDAGARGGLIAEMIEGLDPTTAPPAEFVEQARSWLVKTIQTYRHVLAARGEDPLSPLPDIEEDSVQ